MLVNSPFQYATLMSATPSTREVVSKGCKVGRKSLRLIPVKPVSGARIDKELRPFDSRCERILIAAGTERILIAPNDERGRLDLPELT